MSEILTRQDVADQMISIEANVVASIYSEPILFLDSGLDRKMFKNEIWKCLYIIAEKIVSKGGQSLDQITVETMLSMDGNEKLKGLYDKIGGYRKVELPMDIVDTSNISMWISELKKYSALYDYIKECTLTKNTMTNIFNDFESNDVYDYMTAKMNSVFIGLDTSITKPKELTYGIRDMVAECHKGLSIGMPIPSEILNSEIKGLQMGQVYGIGGLSGSGKTTLVIETILSTIWEHEESATIFLNEQDLKKIQQQIITWIINNKLHPKKLFTSGRWMDGHFTEDEMKEIDEATKMLEDKISDNKIIICELQRYSCKSVCRLIKTYASMGVKYFVLDTFKLSSDASLDNSWMAFMADAVTLYDLVKPSGLNVNLVLTLQLEKGKSAVSRYLSEANLGISKNIKDVFSVLILMRRLYNDEYTGDKNDLKVSMPIEGTQSSTEVTLNRHKQYCVLFIDKNRNGTSNQYQIVAEQHLGYLTYKEVGICSVPFGT